jgi:predicted ATPase/serine/threonine protein kinase
MTPERYRRVEDVFGRALECAPEARERLLEEACAGDDALRREVESLLAEHERATRFLNDPPRATAIFRPETSPRAPGPPHTLAPGAVVDGKYRVEALLGRGGMGEVYRATQLSLQRTIALKIVRGDLAKSGPMLLRFEREALAVARLRHPNIVAVHEYGVEPGVGAFLVMEYLEGRSLRDELAARGRLPVGEALAVMRQLCSAVHAAHEAGVVHRDLKPDNVFLESGFGSSNALGALTAKVLDFGVAKLAGATGPQTGSLALEGAEMGTPPYMAPEQCAGGPADARSDVYALGCVLYELLTGQPPFRGGSRARIAERHVSEPPRAPSKVAEGVPLALDGTILRALAKRPEDRFQSALDLARALDRTVGHTLPHRAGSFVGRDRDVARVAELLSARRLVSLTGVGGIGKTRLAIEIARAVSHEFRDGVCMVELGSLADQSLIPQAVAAALQVREEAGRPLVETLRDALGRRELLLLLDTCEHLVEGCATFVASLLQACPDLRVLATSREALWVEGETRWVVAPLAEHEAIRLFADRARAITPDFAPDAPGTAVAAVAAVAEVCRRLEGIPLAIELAAARTRVMTVEEILERLGDRFALLRGGDRAVPARQRTLEAAVAWSYDLLSEPERALLRRLSVFAGGWTLEAAEAVAGIQTPATLDVLTHVVDKSLVVVDHVDGSTRYRMLETIREYALGRLRDAGGEEAEAVSSHAAWLLALAERVERHLGGPDERTWIATLDPEHDNFRAAFDRSRDADFRLRLCAALAPFWNRRSYVAEARRRLDDALAHAARTPTPERAKALRWAGCFASFNSDNDAAMAAFEECAAMFRALGDKAGLSLGLYALGCTLMYAEQYERAAEVTDESRRVAEEIGDRRRVAWAWSTLGCIAAYRGELHRAIPLLEKSLEIFRSVGCGIDVAATLNNLGGMARWQGDFERAERWLTESAEIARAEGQPMAVATPMWQLGAIADARGRPEEALPLFEEAIDVFQKHGYMIGIALVLEHAGFLFARLGKADRALRLAGAALRIREAIKIPYAPMERSELERKLGPAREALGREADLAFAEGRALEVGEAVRLARER